MYGVLSFVGLPYFGPNVKGGPVDEGSHRYVRLEIRNPKTDKIEVVFFNVDAYRDEN
jgi:hypothetical protein